MLGIVETHVSVFLRLAHDEVALEASHLFHLNLGSHVLSLVSPILVRLPFELLQRNLLLHRELVHFRGGAQTQPLHRQLLPLWRLLRFCLLAALTLLRLLSAWLLALQVIKIFDALGFAEIVPVVWRLREPAWR